ncbi:MAG TPA: ATP-binding protein [Azospirillaceae bacterium]|nr:ATP-binding protein [Azospirillaceae bacterium]
MKGRAATLARSVRFLMTASGVAFILVVNGLIVYGVWQQRDDALRHARHHAAEQTGLLGDMAAQSLRQAALLADDLAVLIGMHDSMPPSASVNLHAYLLKHIDSFPQVVNALVIDPRGAVRLRARDLPSRAELALSIPDLLQPHLDGENGGLIVGSPPASLFRTPAAAIPVTRRLERADGSLNGVLLLLLDPPKLLSAVAGAYPAISDGAALVSRKGDIVLSLPDERRLLDGNLNEWPELAAKIAAAPPQGGVFHLPRHGAEHLIGYRPMADYDFAVLSFRDIGAILADWRRDAVAWTAIGVAMTIVIGALTRYVVQQHEKRETDQAKLLDASRRIRGILDSMVDAVITIDGRGRILTFNPAAERLFGYEEDAILGQSINLLTPQQHHHHHVGIDPMEALTGDGRRVIGADREILAMRRDGASVPVTIAVSALTVAEDPDAPEKATYVGVIRDITKRKQYEAELLASKSAAELANRAKSEFLANMSHELRTPLNAIIGFAEVLDSEYFGPLNTRQKACARDIHESGARLLDVVNAILDMSRIESGRYELKEEAISPTETVAQCLQMLRERADEGGVELVNHITGAAPLVWVDRRAYRQVILNLLSNAVKFTPPGGRVEVAIETPRDGLAVRVSDNGPGVPDDFKPFLYQPFRQADNSASRHYEGVGLGLSIAKNLMALHGGVLTYENRPGGGASFIAVLPAQRLTDAKAALKARA